MIKKHLSAVERCFFVPAVVSLPSGDGHSAEHCSSLGLIDIRACQSVWFKRAF